MNHSRNCKVGLGAHWLMCHWSQPLATPLATLGLPPTSFDTPVSLCCCLMPALLCPLCPLRLQAFDDSSLDFQEKVLMRSGLGEETYLPACETNSQAPGPATCFACAPCAAVRS